ncbi:hemoglobin [Actinoplanes sp. SE50]|uniref:group II truncated hemoglobin n=1 Tax=unclassified Actinoplanes TaxID=2626549 RepID=UPI00023ECAFA|nr:MULTISPECIES: group II truncated hemoglobin [unclassified Actinoplanes]AEV83746.1 hemoglobin [Actinoplanes sp. SE50/110]ATO82110.1 hemoglobin [Actinoplanes sp. SE50]SLL99517.1 hemoglobin [Actinoplanes sp. SE50/110]
MGRSTLYQAAGGAAGMLALATDFHARCLADPVLEHPFSHLDDPEHVQHLAAYWGEVFGGPPTYSGRHGGHSGMLRIHANQCDEDPFSGRFLEVFDEAVAHTLPDDPALRGALHDYMVAATREVAAVFPASATVPDALPMPHWAWSGPTGGDS